MEISDARYFLMSKMLKLIYSLLRLIKIYFLMFNVLDSWSESNNPNAIEPAIKIARIKVLVASVKFKVTNCCVALKAILPGTSGMMPGIIKSTRSEEHTSELQSR